MRIIRYRNVPVVELDTIKASDAFGPGSSPGGHTMIGRQKRYLALKPRCQRGFRHLKGLEIHVHFRRYKIGIFPY